MKRTLELLREFFRRADMLLFSLSIICAVFGIIVITSASASYDSPAKYVIVQAFAMVLGIIAFIVMTLLDIDILADRWPALSIFNALFLLLLILLLLVLFLLVLFLVLLLLILLIVLILVLRLILQLMLAQYQVIAGVIIMRIQAKGLLILLNGFGKHLASL